MLAGFGAAGSHQGFTVLSCKHTKKKKQLSFRINNICNVLNICFRCAISRRSHALGGKPNPKGHRIVFQSGLSLDSSQVLSVLEACRDISLSVSITHGSHRKPAPLSGDCEAICLFCETGSRQTGNVSSSPFPPRDKLKTFYYSESCGFFRKDDSTSTRKLALALSVIISFVKYEVG